MTNSKELFQELLNKINLPDREEAAAILYYLLEAKSGLTRSDILINKVVEVASNQFEDEISRINTHEPIQYIAGYSWFRNQKFTVNPSVLIPRPETELLVQEIIDQQKSKPAILDVGTGSGCIAISLALEIPGSKITALDNSERAIAIAKENARTLGAKVDFLQADFLKNEISLSGLDFLVSNPPYIREGEMESMEANVLNFEPHLALFVSNENPLIFYEALAIQGKKLLKPRGKILAEINSWLGKETLELFQQHGYQDVKLILDLEGKNRIVVASR